MQLNYRNKNNDLLTEIYVDFVKEEVSIVA